MVRLRRRIGREEIDQLTQEDPFYQAEMADDELIDFRTLNSVLRSPPSRKTTQRSCGDGIEV